MTGNKAYFRPIIQSDPVRPAGAVSLAGGRYWFDRLEVLDRQNSRGLVAVGDVPATIVERLTAPRRAIGAVTLDRPRLMGIVNVTPDSFSDGGQFLQAGHAIAQARLLEQSGADILDIGGESTRPGAVFVSVDDEIARIKPVIEGLAGAVKAPISVDTRKADVGRVALACGAAMLNDVSAFSFDPQMIELAKNSGVPVCLMHAQGDPKTMQDQPQYENVLLDVFDYLESRIALAEAAGITRDRIIVDPGIGFGKTVTHNLLLLRYISLFHSLGCAILVGASRKRFIGTLGDAPNADDRVPGSIAVALAAIAQGVQIVRVHDVEQTRQAFALFHAVSEQI